ncbi:phage N-6-adenine-methyltransferase [Aeromonas caviae]|uniref:phage N-6-adenine-methyltransferase n=1 Tax=Aeromonas caviae TaxID=648 RepID=UPI0029DC6C14|nr:phage N-6-adenine-methyltransferase [Aeromonas caviae]MDX7753392.1 phage N-6-adenine-methyltransferase [Aeromonas caviae]MDX7774142.1 phage N-6-adenine-methyltransferase [Aeromonas caviae]
MSDYRGSTTPEATRDMTQTPLWLFRALDLEFNFALDAAALPETALCEKFLTPDIDALSVDWGDFISPSVRSPWAWLNPPYSDIGPWVEKAIEQQGCGIGTVMLVPQDTSTEWYPGMRASEVRHITGYHDANGKWRNGRVSFINKATGEEMKGNPKGSMLLIFAPNWRGECRIRDVSKQALLLAGAEPISAAA